MGVAVIMVILGLLAWAMILTENSLVTNIFLAILGTALTALGGATGWYFYKTGRSQGRIQWW